MSKNSDETVGLEGEESATEDMETIEKNEKRAARERDEGRLCRVPRKNKFVENSRNFRDAPFSLSAQIS
jgi:hypothetical protein